MPNGNSWDGGTDVVTNGTVSWAGVGVILVWLALFVGLATLAVRTAAEAI